MQILPCNLPFPDEPNRRIYISDLVVVQDLARVLNVKPFKVVGKLLELRQFKHVNEAIDFETASVIAREHGYRAVRATSA